jgi:hypothetical protein
MAKKLHILHTFRTQQEHYTTCYILNTKTAERYVYIFSFALFHSSFFMRDFNSAICVCIQRLTLSGARLLSLCKDLTFRNGKEGVLRETLPLLLRSSPIGGVISILFVSLRLLFSVF